MCSSDAGIACRLVNGKPDLVCVITRTSCLVEFNLWNKKLWKEEARIIVESLMTRGFGWLPEQGGPRDTLTPASH